MVRCTTNLTTLSSRSQSTEEIFPCSLVLHHEVKLQPWDSQIGHLGEELRIGRTSAQVTAGYGMPSSS